MKKKHNLNYPKSAAIGFFSKGLKNEFETAVVNEPSVFEPLKFYCINTKKNYEKKQNKTTTKKKKTEILLQVPVLEAIEQRYGFNKGYVLNFSLSQVLLCLLSVIALCEKNDWRQ